MKTKKIAILGSTGSIGTQALEVIERNKDQFEIEVLTAHSNDDLLVQQALAHRPNAVVIVDEEKYDSVFGALNPYDIKVYAGEASLEQVVQMGDVDLVLTAIVGYAGLKPTISAIKAGKHIAIANKETLVVAGELITALAQQQGVNIYPVDSEHSAIFQCLVGEFHNKIEKIYLTASGGPFLGWTQKQLEDVQPEQALKHPNWEMGAKITIDSATLMNKGLEVIEAKWLFGLKPEQIEVIVHPQSIIHSIVQFQDGSMKAQMGLPDMKLPIQYALSYPNRIKSDFKRFDFINYPQLTFKKPDVATFGNLRLAYETLQTGGTAPCILNAANEIAVEAFLKKEINFLDIVRINERCLEKVNIKTKPTLDDYITSNEETRHVALSLLKPTPN